VIFAFVKVMSPFAQIGNAITGALHGVRNPVPEVVRETVGLVQEIYSGL
jgi:hypothetical protein